MNWLTVSLLAVNLALVVISNTCLKVSADSTAWRDFLGWQVGGNLAGLGSVITLTALFRFIPASVAYAFNIGLGFVLVQVLAAWLLFHENISPTQWIGVGFVTFGLYLITTGI